jgi:hypothetical protein
LKLKFDIAGGGGLPTTPMDTRRPTRRKRDPSSHTKIYKYKNINIQKYKNIQIQIYKNINIKYIKIPRG